MKVPERLIRNIGILTEDEVKQLRKSNVAIVGCGGAGGRTAVTLARIGVGSFTLVDGSSFDETNINRQEGANFRNRNQNKAKIVSAILKSVGIKKKNLRVFDINASPEIYEEILSDNDILIDAVDVAAPNVSIELGKIALQEFQIPVITGLEVGWCAQATCFNPEHEMTIFNRYYGINESKEADLESPRLLDQVKHMPAYIRQEAIEAVLSGKMQPPAIAPGVDQLSSLMTRQAYCALTHNSNLVVAPNIIIVDPLAIESKIITI